MSEIVKILERRISVIQDKIEDLKKIPSERIIQSRISPSGRGALYQLRKAFYATLGKKYDKELSINEWKKVAGKLVKFIGDKGLQDIPTKIILEYNIEESNDRKYIKFSRGWVIYFQVEDIEKLDLESIEVPAVEEVE